MGLIILDNNFLAITTPLIAKAKEEILLSSFKLEFTDRPRGKNLHNFFLELFAAKARGVKVNILFNWHADRKSVAKTNFNAGCELKNKNITVKYLPNNRCCHSKLLIIDREFAFIGSHNLSVKSTTENFELTYMITDKAEIKNVVDIYEKIFYDGIKF
jgi:phosphatidylserine/phosphatidylglycerophosphate/cardiolipin synthase-like enzyme